MTDKIEKKESSELTTESDQLVGVDNIDPLITFIKGSILFTTLLISHFVTFILDWSQIATGSFLSMLFAIFLSLFLRSQIVTLNVLLLIIAFKGSAFSL